MTEDEMIGWHHRLDGREFEQAPGGSEGQGSLVCCSPWGCKNLTQLRLNNNNYKIQSLHIIIVSSYSLLNRKPGFV